MFWVIIQLLVEIRAVLVCVCKPVDWDTRQGGSWLDLLDSGQDQDFRLPCWVVEERSLSSFRRLLLLS